MADKDIRSRLLEALEAKASAHGADIVDVEVAGASKAPVVRVRVDRAEPGEPISLDDVASHNGWVGEVVEAVDPFPGSYTLEVSSPGLDRPLRRPADFERFAGDAVQVRMAGHEGRRTFTGTLVGLRDGDVVVECDDGTHALPLADVQSAKLRPVF